MGLQNPVTSAADKYTGLLRASYNLIGEVTGVREFSTTDHLQAVNEEMLDGKKDWDDANDSKLKVIVNDQGDVEKILFLRTKYTGSWMSVQGTMVTGTVLTAPKFSDFLFGCYNLNTPNLKIKWDSLLQTFMCIKRSAAAT